MMVGKRTSRGFSLVELMIVVVLIGILSVVAYVGYRRFVTASYKAEATSVIGGIATAQEGYKAESGAYLNVSGASTNLYPASVPGPFKTEWGGACVSCSGSWTTLAYKPSAPVIFGYSTVASTAATPSSARGGPIHTKKIQRPTPAPAPASTPATGAFFTTTAMADTDGDGVYTTALYFSDSKVITFDDAE